MDPEFGLLMPSEFIQIAEDTGGVNELGSWVISEACVQAAGWELEGAGHPRHPLVSVNVSTRQLDRNGFDRFVQDRIRGAGLLPAQMGIEVTESALMADIEHAAGVLARLHAEGVRIALDDFGTGYSSLAYLRQLPIDVLKIDRSFVADLDDTGQNMAIVSRIVELAHDLGFTVVAEGVETARQLEALEAVGCDAAQGFLFGRPVVADAVGSLLGSVPSAFAHRVGR
jgi:EAL domain-containing protein (putative c-di-GMP-specific phosphodiesterase class I)